MLNGNDVISGYKIHKYLNSKNGVRWLVEKDGKEILIDQTRKYLCHRYIDELNRKELKA